MIYESSPFHDTESFQICPESPECNRLVTPCTRRSPSKHCPNQNFGARKNRRWKGIGDRSEARGGTSVARGLILSANNRGKRRMSKPSAPLNKRLSHSVLFTPRHLLLYNRALSRTTKRKKRNAEPIGGRPAVQRHAVHGCRRFSKWQTTLVKQCNG